MSNPGLVIVPGYRHRLAGVMFCKFLCLVSFFLFYLCFCSVAAAHGLRIQTKVQNNTLHVTAYTSDAKPLKQGTVTVVDSTTQTKLSTGLTDPKGRFTCEIEQGIAEVSVKVTDNMGHMVSSNLKLPAELAHDLPVSPGLPDQVPDPVLTLQAKTLEAVVRHAVRAELEEFKRSQLENPQISIQDILAGLGYILGLFAIVTWFKKS